MKILAHAQELICQLLEGMPSPYQRQSLQAMLELFLRAQGAPLPEHSDFEVSECAESLSNGLHLVATANHASLADVLVTLLLADLERKCSLLKQQGIEAQITRCKI